MALSKQKTPPFPVLDAADWRLLGLMQTDASLSNQDLAEAAHLSPATCHRRVRRLLDLGMVERQVAVLAPARVALAAGHEGLAVLVEVTLDVQSAERLDAFEANAVADSQVQQVWRVSPSPDFVLVAHVPNMPAYQALARRLFNDDANVRNVRAMFSVRRAKFTTVLPLPGTPGPVGVQSGGDS